MPVKKKLLVVKGLFFEAMLSRFDSYVVFIVCQNSLYPFPLEGRSQRDGEGTAASIFVVFKHQYGVACPA